MSYNGDEVIEINVSSDPQRTVDISDSSKGKSVEFSYSVKWKKTAITYDHRMDRYSRYSFLPQHLEVSAVGGVVRACTREKGGSIGAMPRCVINSFPFPCLPFPQIHWFSIINSCVTVLLLTGFLATILLRVLKVSRSGPAFN